MKHALPLVATLALTAGFAQAALLADWSAPGVRIATDATGDNTGDAGVASDILSIRHTQQGGYHFFLMTLAARPSASTFARGYTLNFDFAPGGADNSGSYFVAGGLTGIDFIMEAQYFLAELLVNRYHRYVGGDSPQFDTVNNAADPHPALFSVEEDFEAAGVFAMEWRVVPDLFTDMGVPDGTDFTLWGATHSMDLNRITYDTTPPLTVPEPGTMGLAGLAALMVAVRRRRQA